MSTPFAHPGRPKSPHRSGRRPYRQIPIRSCPRIVPAPPVAGGRCRSFPVRTRAWRRGRGARCGSGWRSRSTGG